jgi:peptidyl-prolyl cis-trans isomerase SurA
MKNKALLSLWICSIFLLGASAAHAQASKGAVVEEIVARVNNQIITLSDYHKADDTLRGEIAQDCEKCPQSRMDEQYKDRQKDLLRDLIDQQLLVERGKDMGLSVDTDIVKRLDDVRKQNNLATLDDLQKAVESSGVGWDDYKKQIGDSILTQKVIGQEVGQRMNITSDEVKQYYEAHKEDFVRPEQVQLGEIFLTTDGKSPDEIAAIRTKADDLHNRVLKGEDFVEIAKRYSDGTTAKEGGDLGVFGRGQLAPSLEAAVFDKERNHVTDVIQTKTGFEILKVVDHFDAGQQPLEKVENEIQNKLYNERMQPALREYLAQLREESYVLVKPGYTDSAAIAGQTMIQEVPATPDAPAKKKKKLPGSKASGL